MADRRGVRGHVSLVLTNLLVLGAALWAQNDRRAPAVRIEPAPTSSPAPSPTPVRLHVYVTGAVVRSAVVVLPDGARAGDAIAACGGLGPKADPVRVNLAAPLGDGQQVHVPAVGEPEVLLAAPVSAGSSGGSRGAAGSGAATGGAGATVAVGSDAAMVNINTAGQTELESLPGVGPALAARIIAYREANGPFASAEGLLAVSGIGDKTLERLAPRVAVR